MQDLHASEAERNWYKQVALKPGEKNPLDNQCSPTIEADQDADTESDIVISDASDEQDHMHQ